MNVLALDTAGPEPGVCLLARGMLFEELLPSDRQASERLLETLERALGRAAVSLADCDRIAVCSGPGSFTGLRVGLSTAWALARALAVPVEEVSTLEAMAGALAADRGTRVTAALDAGRGEIVAQEFAREGARPRPIGPPVRVRREEADRLSRPITALPAELLGSLAEPPAVSLSRALALAVAAEPREVAGAPGRPPRAIYSRPSAAEEERGAS